MEELGLSLLAHGPDTASVLRSSLEQFGAGHRAHVEISVFEWEDAWPELVKVALYRHGPNVSEVGSTWIGSLVGMNALKPFGSREMSSYGGAAAFLPSVWQPGIRTEFGEAWALPWLAYTRLIYYRRDLLEKAGIDERSAFQTHEHLEDTLSRLAKGDVSNAWCVPTRRSRDTLHNAASWIWKAGGRFVSEDGRQILFNEREAREGFRSYFELYRYIPASARARAETDSLFKQGQAAITMSGPWLWPLSSSRRDVAPEVAANIGVAVPLDTAFVGFSYLVVWEHSRNERLAKQLVQELTQPQVLDAYASRTGPLSVRPGALEGSPLVGETNYQTMVRALKTGRTFLQIPLWGLIEEKLCAALDSIGEEVLADPTPDIDAALSKHLDPLARRLETTLSKG